MKEKIKFLIQNPLLSGSLIMILGSNAVNVLNYIYNVVMVRNLSPSDFGELKALFSLVGLLGVIPMSLGLVAVRSIASSKDDKASGDLIKWLSNQSFKAGVILFILVTIFSQQVSSFLKIEHTYLIILLSFSFVFSLPSIYIRASLQGLLKFKQLVFVTFLENGVKLVLGVILVLLGFKVFGAIIGLVVAIGLGWLAGRIFVGKYLTRKITTKIEFKSLAGFALPVMLQSVAMTSLYSTDVLLVKHFFLASEAGVYGAFSTLGQIILFGAGPITAVMFPLVTNRHAKGQGYKMIFLLSLLLTSCLISGVLIIYFFIPQLTIRALYGNQALYLSHSELLFRMGLFIGLFTLCSLLVNFYLSIGKTKVIIFPIIAAILQGLGIWFFHNSLIEVVMLSTLVAGGLLAVLLLYLSREKRAA